MSRIIPYQIVRNKWYPNSISPKRYNLRNKIVSQVPLHQKINIIQAMFVKLVMTLSCLILVASACSESQPVDPDIAQQKLNTLWNIDQHIIWEIDWPAAPVGGPITVETWRAGSRYRYEILESTASALIGETLVSDGKNRWQYNRFDPPPTFEPTSNSLSPVSDVFTLIDRLLMTPAVSAREAPAQINLQPVWMSSLTFAGDDKLTIWWSQKTSLPVRVQFSIDGQSGELLARQAEPLPNPPPALFEVGDWLRKNSLSARPDTSLNTSLVTLQAIRLLGIL